MEVCLGGRAPFPQLEPCLWDSSDPSRSHTNYLKTSIPDQNDQTGKVERYKVQIVAQGFTQHEGVDYQGVFALVANLKSVWIIVTLVAKYNLKLDQMDISTAYLNGELNEELYMLPPSGVPIQAGYCWHLKCSLYGVKHKTLDWKLGELGFVQLNAETCLYLFQKEGQICFLVVYVDDLLLAASTQKFMDQIKSTLGATFKMHDLGKAKYILGIELKHDKQAWTISLPQSQYIHTVLEWTRMKDCKPTYTPLQHNLKLTPVQPGETPVMEMSINGKWVSYLIVIGLLMYAMLGTQPDLTFTVGLLSHFSAAPTGAHWEAAKHTLHYLQATKNMELVYNGSDITMNMDFHG